MVSKQAFRRGPLLLQLVSIVVLVLPFVSDTFRDNDQATILSGSWQMAHQQASFLHAVFYNFDKQWGVYLALDWLFRVFPHADPILAGNILITAIASFAWLSLGIRIGRTRRPALPLLLPVLLSPVLILYIPFLGSGWFSLAFLLLAFFFLGNMRSRFSRGAGIVLVAAAASCRGDVILAIPALALSLNSRARLNVLFRRPLLWALACAAVAPVLLGKLLAGVTIADLNPLSFDPKSYFGFLLFGLTPAAVLTLLLAVVAFLSITARKPRFWFFYAATAVALLIPLAFYSLQLYTLRYLFLTLASLLFVVGSRRATWLYRAHRHAQAMSFTLVVLTVAPWLVGLRLPLLTRPQITSANPTRFPTGDGEFPMFAYLGFQWQALFDDHLAIDHNQRIWLAARSVNYQPCSDNAVPFLITPMSNFLELAIRLQNKRPRPIDFLAESPCGIAYVDARTILRGIRPDPRDGAFFQNGVSFDSRLNNGQIIVRVNTRAPQSDESQILKGLREALGPRYVEMYLDQYARIPVRPGRKYAVFASTTCQISAEGQHLTGGTGLIRAQWTGSDNANSGDMTCPTAHLSGWARTVYPPYMGL